MGCTGGPNERIRCKLGTLRRTSSSCHVISAARWNNCKEIDLLRQVAQPVLDLVWPTRRRPCLSSWALGLSPDIEPRPVGYSQVNERPAKESSSLPSTSPNDNLTATPCAWMLFITRGLDQRARKARNTEPAHRSRIHVSIADYN